MVAILALAGTVVGCGSSDSTARAPDVSPDQSPVRTASATEPSTVTLPSTTFALPSTRPEPERPSAADVVDVSGVWVMESAADNAVTGTLTAIDGGFAYRSEPSPYAVSWDCTLLGQPGSEGTLTCASRDGMAATFVYSGPITSIDSGRKFRFDGRMTGPESVPQTLADRPMVLRPG